MLVFSAQGFAKENISEIKTEISKPTAEANETLVVQTPQLAVSEQNQQDPKCSGTCMFETELINLSFSNENIPDTTNFNVIEYYIKNVMHLLKNVDPNSIEMIEVL